MISLDTDLNGATSGAPVLSIIIVNWNSAKLLDSCLRSIELSIKNASYEAIVIDNASRRDDVLLLKNELEKKYAWARFLYSSKNAGYAAANNIALKHARGEYVLLLNPDTRFVEDGLEKLLSIAESPRVGAVGCKLLNEDGTTQLSIFRFPTLGRIAVTSLLLHRLLPPKLRKRFAYAAADCEAGQTPDWILGAFMIVSRDLMERLGGFDESIFMYGEDLDLCYRIRKQGLEIVHVPDFSVVHYGGSSGRQAWTSAQREARIYDAIFYFQRKHFGRLRLLAAKSLCALGALLRIAIYALWAASPRARGRCFNEIRTQEAVLLRCLRRD